MHSFAELIDRCTAFTLNRLAQTNEKVIQELQTSAATTLVKALQMIRLQKIISAVGMFSIFEAMLQDRLDCADGFREAQNILDAAGEPTLKEQFGDLLLAINVLKHGRGRSYDALVVKADRLPFRVKGPEEAFFFEGDVSEVGTLIDVDDGFVLGCADVIRRVSESVQKARPGTFL